MPPASDTHERLHAPYLVFILVLSLYAVAALAFTTFTELPAPTTTILDYADNAVCVVFFIDFVVTLLRCPNRRRYLLTWGWLDLVSSIPVVDSLRWARAARVARILRVLRGIRAAKILSEFILYRRAQSAFLAALLVSILLIVLAASAILQFETSTEANIRTAEDALWWAAVTVTTVGYGDKFPISSEGRLTAVLLMTAGVGLFGTFSGFVAAWFLESPRRQSETEGTLAGIQEQLAGIHEILRRLERL